MIRCYLTLDDTLTIESVFTVLKERPRGAELLMRGDININLEELEGDWREEEIAAMLTMEGGSKTCRPTSSRDGSHGDKKVGRGTCSGWVWRCGPRQIIS